MEEIQVGGPNPPPTSYIASYIANERRSGRMDGHLVASWDKQAKKVLVIFGTG